MDKRAALGQHIRDLMDNAGHSENSLAETTGIPRVTLRRRLDAPENLSVGEIARIAAALHVEPSALTEYYYGEAAA
ncbi:helix-turn-helix domain-containing protein [Nesterenkonia sp. PF2B19]|uniref:helix-turn-helix domain-containing protein n=1 Tax=Nesterenkonia sp. PF2B19 TaxID=1881858 RepID=UPI0009F5BCEF|nr:helix-turn-helix transcriptional regulator [Nesterenkonia sp. PF2B19]OSM43500.1 hypothetical protein BCY76_008250 [Nesterenkonia sp. PF2B19]